MRGGNMKLKKLNFDEIKDDIIAYYLSGHSLSETAKQFGISASSVSKCLKLHNVPRRPSQEATKIQRNTETWRKQHSARLKGKQTTSTLGKRWTYNKVMSKPWMKGENNPSWKGGKTPLNFALRSSVEYAQWRSAVFERDNYTCVRCAARTSEGCKVTLNVDHIVPLSSSNR